MPTRKIVLALIGKGKWGQNYISTIPQLKGCILDPNNIRTSDYSDLLNKKEIDGVIIASPTKTHYKIARTFLNKGFNLLIEKPITKTYDEAVNLAKLASKHPKQIVMVGHIQLYNPGYLLTKKVLSKIGEIIKLEYYGLQSTPREDVTIIEDWGAHPTYLFQDLLKQEPIRVKTETEKQEQVKLTYYYNHNIIGQAHIAWISDIKKRQMVIYGKAGTLIFDDVNKTVSLTKNKRLSIFQVNLRLSPLAQEVTEFISAIKQNRQPLSDINQAVSIMKVMQQFEQSSIKNM